MPNGIVQDVRLFIGERYRQLQIEERLVQHDWALREARRIRRHLLHYGHTRSKIEQRGLRIEALTLLADAAMYRREIANLKGQSRV